MHTDGEQLIIDAIHELGAGSPRLWASKYLFFAARGARGEFVPHGDKAWMQAYERWQSIVQRLNHDAASRKMQTGQHTPGAKVNLQEGTTGRGSDGSKYMVRGGVWVRES